MIHRPRRTATKVLFERPFIQAFEHDLEEPGVPSRKVITLGLRDWVMVAAVTREGRFVLVEQHRHGIDGPSLEFPGGIVDDGESPEEAGARELLEESGYRSSALVSLGWVHPNPALHQNRSFLYLAPDALRVADPEQHDDERVEVSLMTAAELAIALESGKVTHALAVLCGSRALSRVRAPDEGALGAAGQPR